MAWFNPWWSSTRKSFLNQTSAESILFDISYYNILRYPSLVTISFSIEKAFDILYRF